MITSKDSGTALNNTLTKTGLRYRLVCMKIDEIIDRPRRRWAEDGVVELTMGLLWFLTGAIFWFGQTVQPRSSFGAFWAFAQSILWFCALFGSTWAMRRLKERVIAPRGGYVALMDAPATGHIAVKGMVLPFRWWRLLGPVLTLLCSLALWWLKSHDGWWRENPRAWTWMMGPAFALFLVIFILWWAVWRLRVLRYLWLAGLALVLGLWMYLTRAPFERNSVMIAWLGGGLAVMGAIRFKSFLRDNPRIESE